MKIKNTLILLILILGSVNISKAQLLLNEVKVNPPGDDNPFEFIELKGKLNLYILYCILDEYSSEFTDTVGSVFLQRIDNITNSLFYISDT